MPRKNPVASKTKPKTKSSSKMATRKRKTISKDNNKDKDPNPPTDVDSVTASKKTEKNKTSKNVSANDSSQVSNDPDRTESHRIFESLFFEEVATTVRTAIKYPKRKVFPMYIDILKGSKGDTKEMKKTYNTLRPGIKKKYCLYFDEEKEENILYSSQDTVSGQVSRRIAAYEDVFEILYTNCIASNHNLKVAQVKILSTYGNITNTLIAWFQETCCVGCQNKNKHGNCKKKLKITPSKDKSEKEKYMSLMASLTAMGNMPKPVVIEPTSDDNSKIECSKGKSIYITVSHLINLIYLTQSLVIS